MLYEIQAISDEDWTEERIKLIESRWRSERDALQPKDEKKAGTGKAKGKGKKKKDDDEDGDEDEGDD